jgi:hypothetical protein
MLCLLPVPNVVGAATCCNALQVYEQLEKRLEHLIFMQQQQQLLQGSAADTDIEAAAAGEQARVSAPADPRRCPVCGGQLVLKPSRATGGFIGCRWVERTECTLILRGCVFDTHALLQCCNEAIGCTFVCGRPS